MKFRIIGPLRSGLGLWTALACSSLFTSCTNFHEVDPGRYYRSAQPDEEQLSGWIEAYGLKTVVKLNGGAPGDSDFDRSREPALAAGAEFIHLPLSATKYPSPDDLVRLWEIFETAEYPVLVHCRAGADRTGLASGIYVLQNTGDLNRARDQLNFFPYLHVGWDGTWVMDQVFDLYEPFATEMSFPKWARTEYPGLVGPIR